MARDASVVFSNSPSRASLASVLATVGRAIPVPAAISPAVAPGRSATSARIRRRFSPRGARADERAGDREARRDFARGGDASDGRPLPSAVSAASSRWLSSYASREASRRSRISVRIRSRSWSGMARTLALYTARPPSVGQHASERVVPTPPVGRRTPCSLPHRRAGSEHALGTTLVGMGIFHVLTQYVRWIAEKVQRGHR